MAWLRKLMPWAKWTDINKSSQLPNFLDQIAPYTQQPKSGLFNDLCPRLINNSALQSRREEEELRNNFMVPLAGLRAFLALQTADMTEVRIPQMRFSLIFQTQDLEEFEWCSETCGSDQIFDGQSQDCVEPAEVGSCIAR